ncbi:hypothetical protein Leryth_009061 [Lithospermum erythrorhizon]|nr:hypothetical protein Leryth_009061 [Lithospermum erythrorhizon]
MFKSKLNETCHKKKWALPKYSCMRDGPDHNPQFKASVVVDGVNFDTETIWKSSKETYNEAAKFAFLHFTSENSSQKPKANPEASDEKNGEKEDQELKKKLEIFAQSNKLGTPTYRCKKEGPLQHPLSFKGTVAIGGHSYDSPSLYTNLHEAEAAAAQAALLSLAIDAFKVENTNSYKDLLKEFAEKEGLFSPTYTTIKAGSNHELKFISMVEFNGERFCGKPANSSKQAEINAAMVAHTTICNSKFYYPTPYLFRSLSEGGIRTC